MQDDRVARLRALNDTLRRHHTGGRIVVTSGLHRLGPVVLRRVLNAVATFCDFDPSNDPYAEHDFGKVTEAGLTVFFKIDYYDRNKWHRSEDPADPKRTLRVMTVMLADDY